VNPYKALHFSQHISNVCVVELTLCLNMCSKFYVDNIKLNSVKQPKVPGSLNFDSRHNLGPLKTWWSPIFEFFIFTDSRVFFPGYFEIVFFRKFQPFYQLGLIYYQNLYKNVYRKMPIFRTFFMCFFLIRKCLKNDKNTKNFLVLCFLNSWDFH